MGTAVDQEENNNTRECEGFIQTAKNPKRAPFEAEAYLYPAQVYTLERCHCADPNVSKAYLDKGRAALQRANSIATDFPVHTRGLNSDIDATEHMFLSTFYPIVTNAERPAVVQAMAKEFVGTTYWYYCQNGHPFTIGECGDAMQESLCPECDSAVIKR